MRKMKASIKIALASTLVVTSTAAIAYATPKILESKSIERENKLKLAVEKVDGDTVKVALDNVQEIPKSLQFSIQLQGAILKDGANSIKDLIKKESEARLKSNAYSTNSNDVLVDYTYNENANTIDVLITSENAIPKISNKIEIFELDVKPESSNMLAKNDLPTYKIVPSNNYEYKYVSNTNREYISKTVDHDNESISLNMSPTIKSGDTYIELAKGEKLELTAKNLGITMEDPEGKEVRLEVKKDGVEITEFLSDTAGVYELSCTAIDNYGDRSETITVQIFIAENKSLTIEAENKVITVGDKFDILDGVAVKDEDGNVITDTNIDVKVEGKGEVSGATSVDTSKPGEYKVTYSVINDKGIKFEKEITVTVVPRMEEINSVPVINAEDKVIKLGETFDPLKGVTATDKEDKDLTKEIKYESNVDVNSEGEYIVKYTVQDSQGATVTKTIKVIVKKNVILAESIAINNKFNKLYVGGSKILTATINEAADIKEIEWTTSDENIASIELVGNSVKVIAKSEGKVTITASTTDGSNKSDSVIIDIINLENDDEVPSFIKDMIDTNIVTPLIGTGDINSPLEMEVQNVTVEEFNSFLENLRELNPTLEKKYEDGNFTVYKIKVNKKSELFITSDEAYIELRLENSLDNFSELKTELEELLKLAENPGDENNSEDGSNSGNGNNSGTENNSGNGSNSENENSSESENNTGIKLPITGQESILGYLGVAAIAAGTVLFKKRRKK
ncbi:immunoglobulin-like domain-containing protein [Clostridium sp.]|uniref:immunoglobulin-like domain-containing protein n=1 Tax=Clostridium sp. TaxID=1506 RepID=UPI0025C48BA9|nr:immunoglobulin-like domain-containing protein [Clostridium sp.]